MRVGKISRDGSTWIAGLLAMSLVLVLILAWQALEASHSHRAVAEGVLRDYARLAADEFVRRSSAQVGYYGYYQVLSALEKGVANPADALPEREALLLRDPRLERALSLVRFFFRFDPAGDRFEVAGGSAPSAAVEDWLRRGLEAPARGEDEGVMTARRAVIEGKARSFVHAVDDRRRFLGFEVEPEGLRGYFQEVLERQTLLPSSLKKTGDDLDYLVLQVRDAESREIFRAERKATAERPDPYLAASVPYGDTYEGIFEGLTARVTLYPSAASKLVIGGLPRSRLPILFGLLLLTVGLLLAAMRQLGRARALAQMRSDFVSQVSHELRTPLTQVRMFAETLILGRVRNEAEERRSLQIIDQEARRLSHLVENILQFSRSERGDLRLAPRPRELEPFLEEILLDLKPLLGRRTVSLVLDPTVRPVVVIDDEAMRQVLLNLLDNAVKYGPPEQQIRIGLERGEDGWVRLWVDDEGPGIPASQRSRIWRSFERLERDRRSAVAGTGIGLAVVRELVVRMGLKIHVEEGERGGARFVLSLPFVEEGEVAGEARSAAGEVPA